MSEKKLEKQHVDEIKAIQEKYTKNTDAIANATKRLYDLQLQIQEIEDFQKKELNQWNMLRTQEAELVTKLENHYGVGQIDINREVFIEEAAPAE